MTFSRLFQGQEQQPGIDRLFFTKAAEPQAFRHPLLTHLQHTLYSQLDGGNGGVSSGVGAAVDGNLSGKTGFGTGSDYIYSTPHRHSHSWLGKPHKSHKSNSTALSALTLLAFLFFLNLLQNCLREQMETMNPTVMVMTAGAGREERLEKSAEQSESDEVDDGGETESFFPEERVHTNVSSAGMMKGANYHQRQKQQQQQRLQNWRPESEEISYSSFTTERTRFERISVASYSTHDSTSPKSVLFRTRF